MREIKFRAKLYDKWNTKKDGDWFYYTPEEMNQYIRRLPLDWSTQCEFTGLKDKNGKEIYEGDWIKNTNDEMDYFEGQVDFSDGIFWISEGEGKPAYILGQHDSKNDLEVIGNIYENPELLKT